MDFNDCSTFGEHRQRERKIRELQTPFIPHDLPIRLPSPPEDVSDFYFDDLPFDYSNVPYLDIRAPRSSPVPWENNKLPFSPGKQAALETLPFPPSPRPSPTSYDYNQHATNFEQAFASSQSPYEDFSTYDFEAQEARKRALIAELNRLEEVGRYDRSHMPHSMKNSYLASKAVSTAMNQLETVVPSDISTHQRQEYRNIYWALIRNSELSRSWTPRAWVRDEGTNSWVSFEQSHLSEDFQRTEIDPIDDPSQIEPLRETLSTALFDSPSFRRRRPSWPYDHYVANPDHPMRLMKPVSSPHWKFVRLMERKRRVAHATQGRWLSELVAAAVCYGLPLLPSSVKGGRHNNVPRLPASSPDDIPAAPSKVKEEDFSFSGADSPRKLFRSQEVFRSGSAGVPLSYSLSSSDRPPLQKGYKTPSGSTASANSRKQRASSLRFDSPQRQPSETSTPYQDKSSTSKSYGTHTPSLAQTHQDESKTTRSIVEVTEPADLPGSPEEVSAVEIIDTLESTTSDTPEICPGEPKDANPIAPTPSTPSPTPLSPSIKRRSSVAERVQKYESRHLSPKPTSASSTPSKK